MNIALWWRKRINKTRNWKFKKNKKLIFNKSERKIKIKYLKWFGFDNNDIKRPIGTKIKKYFSSKNIKCVNCGTTNNIIPDHKNDLYNDLKVLDIKTQTIDDFQALCRNCNKLKGSINKKMLKTKKRPSALDVPIPSLFGIAYTKGDETFDENDPNWGIGCYWYDPIKFIKDCIEIIKQ